MKKMADITFGATWAGDAKEKVVVVEMALDRRCHPAWSFSSIVDGRIMDIRQHGGKTGEPRCEGSHGRYTAVEASGAVNAASTMA